MAQRRISNSRNVITDDETDEDRNSDPNEDDSCTYIQELLRPLQQGAGYNTVLGWMGIVRRGSESSASRNKTATSSKGNVDRENISQSVWITYGVIGVLASVLLYQLILTDFGLLFHKLCSIVQPLFSISCAFYWLAFYLRKTWSSNSIFTLFCACFAGEFIGQCMCDSAQDSYITQPFLSFAVMVAVSIASMFSTLETVHSAVVVGFITFIRFLACTTLGELPRLIRPFLAYIAGIVGVIGSKYMETTLKNATCNSGSSQEGKAALIKRRRSSSSSAHNFAQHRVGRRTSLPALIHKSQTSSSYESAIISEAHGLISDMLADPSLPLHVVSGLHAVSSLLKPPDTHGPVHKARVSPLVSLTETNYGSDSEDLPYTGERPSSLPKRLRRSLPPSLLRRMSTSTWTTTTSATGLPTLEPEPCRTRSCSFRHSRDNTPGSSPSGSRSNSPSPSSPTALSLTIPKSRSFSVTGTGSGASGYPSGSSSTNQKRGSRERRGLFQASDGSPSPVTGASEKMVGSTKSDLDGKQSDMTAGISKRFNITSDYESSDSPSSSDHSDNIMSVDEMGGPIHSLGRSTGRTEGADSGTQSVRSQEAVDSAGSPPPASSELTNTLSSLHQHHPSITASTAVPATSSVSSPSSSSTLTNSSPSGSAVSGHHPSASSSRDHNRRSSGSSKSLCSEAGQLILEVERASLSSASYHDAARDEGSRETSVLPYDSDEVLKNDSLDIHKLNQWDYHIFDLALEVEDCILSMMACRLFSELGLFETFRIPTEEFISYFHALELGYREKPYHNRIHATDVLHGVYYLTTQPIPGFVQISPDGDSFNGKTSSSESDSDVGDRCCARTNFTAEDSYGIMGGNIPPLELMALYAAAAMHDYDHPGRTNAFLVTTNAPLAILYNDRSVLESHHAASAWRLYLNNPRHHWLAHLDKAEFKRFRFLVIEAILATDLKRHFELLAEFNAKVNDEDAPGIDWTSESDRLMTTNMIIKMADINGPCKRKELHFNWTNRISEEFYEQGDEEERRGLPISPYMDRRHPQLAKLQESFINHLVAPLCNALSAAGLIPGTWIEGAIDNDGADTDKGDGTSYKDTEDEDAEVAAVDKKRKRPPIFKMRCRMTQNLKDNHDMWVNVLKQEAAQKERDTKPAEETKKDDRIQGPRGSLTLSDKDGKLEMEPIKEEDTPPNSANNIEELNKASDRLIQEVSSQSAASSQLTSEIVSIKTV